MSRTHHHSEKWGPKHRWFEGRKDTAGFGSRRVGEAPGWHVHMFDTVPARGSDVLNTRKLVIEPEAADEALFSLGRRKPHKYYW